MYANIYVAFLKPFIEEKRLKLVKCIFIVSWVLSL